AMERPPRASGGCRRHAVPRSTATILGEVRSVSLPLADAGRLSDSSRLRVSLAPSRVQLCSEAVAPRLDGCPSSPRLWLRNAGIGPSPQPAPRWSGANLVHPHKAGWPPTAVVARGTGREHRLSSVTVSDQPPGLAPEVLVERMRMPNLRGDGLATPRAAGAQCRVPLCSARAPPRWQEAQPDLTAPNAGAPVGVAARWTAPAVR